MAAALQPQPSICAWPVKGTHTLDWGLCVTASDTEATQRETGEGRNYRAPAPYTRRISFIVRVCASGARFS